MLRDIMFPLSPLFIKRHLCLIAPFARLIATFVATSFDVTVHTYVLPFVAYNEVVISDFELLRLFVKSYINLL